MNGVPLPLLYVSHTQVNAIVPLQVPGGSGTIRLIASGVNLAIGVEVASRSPAFFQLSGEAFAAALGEDGRVITPQKPARPGEVVALFGTGFGRFSTNVADGKLISLTPPWPSLAQSTELSSFPVKRLEIVYAGPAPGLIAGVVQINIRVPAEATNVFTIGLPDGNVTELPVQ
jgi:uncharacterized protein (TIGR03437 family)